MFTLEQARVAGLRKDELYDLLAVEEIERVGRGVYLYPGMLDERFVSLAAATALRSEATMCLTSALAHHDLTDVIPFDTDIALPCGTRHPAGFDHVTWHSFSTDTFTLGRETHRVAPAVTMAIYPPTGSRVQARGLGVIFGSSRSRVRGGRRKPASPRQ